MKKVLILGAGLSGLSLAYRLSKKDFSITLLEKRETYQNDRTWCFWNTSSHPFEDLIDYRWNKWQVNHKGRSKVCSSSAYEYQMISAETFYRELIARLKSQGNVDICLGVEVKDIVKQEKSFEAITSKGFFLADSVYDSRPNVMTSLLYQHFHGWHIQIDRPLFDPSKVILMDFDVDQSKGIHFMYVLPFSPFEALVEPTFLSDSPLEKSAYESSLDAYLSSRYGIKAFKIIREEKGVLPLSTHFKTSFVPDLKYIGSAGGWMRSSTGYAFLSIQEAIERHLSGREYDKKAERMLDRIFLSYIKNYPQEAPHLFYSLFEKNEPASLVRFLGGQSSPLETLKVISTLPKWPFIKEAFR